MDGPEFYGRDDRGRHGRPLFLYLVYLLHGGWFAAQAACLLVSAAGDVLAGDWFRSWVADGPRSPYWFAMNLCIYIAVILVSGFVILCFAALWTWIYRRIRGCEIDRTHKPRQDIIWSDMPLGLKCAIGYGAVFLVLSVGGSWHYLSGFFDMAFGDTTGAGPLIGMLVGPMLVAILFVGCLMVLVLAACLIPGWFFSNRMLGYITETLRYFSPAGPRDAWE